MIGMKFSPFLHFTISAGFLMASAALASGASQTIEGRSGVTLPAPPPTATHVVTDDLHGTKIDDPYRWLEDAKSPETRAWIESQIKYTDAYLSQIKNRPEIVEELTKLTRVDIVSTPVEYGGRLFFTKRLADENQASIYMREGWKGVDIRLIDATKLSADQNTSVTISDISSDGKLLVYGVRKGGADEESEHTFDVDKKQDLLDVLPSGRHFGVNISPDKQGLYYALFTHDGTTVRYHKFGTPIDSDSQIFGKSYRGEKLGEMELLNIGITDNGHSLYIYISRGVPAKRVDILVKDLRKPQSEFEPLAYGIDAQSSVADLGDRFFLLTDYKSPNERIVEATLGQSPEQWKTIVPEGKNVIDGFSIVGSKLFVRRLQDVKSETSIYSPEGKLLGTIAYPGIGSASDLGGRPVHAVGFYSFDSPVSPPTIYRYDTATGKSEVFFQPKVPFNSSQYEIKQVFYTSKDGTRVPMFIAGKKGLKQDGSARVLMTGYGGFQVSMLPSWSPLYAWWMEQGGYFALPNLRGGSEYGEPWHEAGMFEHKQNVFDDWYAAAEYLEQNHYTVPERFAIAGASNGGLLMGASITQHPELFGAIWCGYPLLDMLRYQNFLFGRLWTTEYGSADNEKDFHYLLQYSPYHNVKPGAKYPAIMFFTGDSDTRVDPLHARKMAALAQADNGGNRPILLHYSLQAGHSAGVSVAQHVEDQADELSFLWNETGPQ